MPFSWRPAAPTDDAFLRDVHDATCADLAGLPAELRRPLLEMQRRARHAGHAEQYPDAGRRILLAGKQRAGQLLVAWTGPHGVVVDFAVHPAWQGRGVGMAALQALQAEALTGDTPRGLVLHVRADSPACRLYARAGFTVTGTDGLTLALAWGPPGSG